MHKKLTGMIPSRQLFYYILSKVKSKVIIDKVTIAAAVTMLTLDCKTLLLTEVLLSLFLHFS